MMNKVFLNFWGTLRKPKGLIGDSIETSDGETIFELLLRLGYMTAEIEYIKIFMNEKEVNSNHVLKDQETIDFFIPVGGG